MSSHLLLLKSCSYCSFLCFCTRYIVHQQLVCYWIFQHQSPWDSWSSCYTSAMCPFLCVEHNSAFYHFLSKVAKTTLQRANMLPLRILDSFRATNAELFWAASLATCQSIRMIAQSNSPFADPPKKLGYNSSRSKRQNDAEVTKYLKTRTQLVQLPSITFQIAVSIKETKRRSDLLCSTYQVSLFGLIENHCSSHPCCLQT